MRPDPLVEALFGAVREQADAARVARVTIGLGYTSVETTDGRVGLSYTMAGDTICCNRLRGLRDFDDSPAGEVLDCVRSDDTLERSIGIALVNALNQPRVLTMPEDTGALTAVAGIRSATRVAMVGYFPPVVARLKGAGAELSVLDRGLDIGDEARFLRELRSWPDVLIVTAATILNATFELFMEHVRPEIPVVVLGPTTPMVPEAFAAFPVTMLGGMVVLEKAQVVSAVRQAAVTPAVRRYCRRVFWVRPVT